MTSEANIKGVSWTDAQRAAIDARGVDVVVSASAGSGKTAVLTERVLQLISGAGGQVKLDQLLIITFTEKAARQMRERIEGRIRGALENDPENLALADALNALPAAWIMTIDAFCRRVVVEHFHRAGVPPTARVPEGTELARLELEEIERLLERTARGPRETRERLERLIRADARGRDGLIAMLRGLMHFMESLDAPEAWMRRTREHFERTLAAQRFEELPEAFTAFPAFRRATLELAEGLERVTAAAHAAGGDPARLEGWARLADQLGELAEVGPPLRLDTAAAWATRADETLKKLVNKGVCGEPLYSDKLFLKLHLEPFSKRYCAWREAWTALDEAGALEGARLAAQRGLHLLALAEKAIEAITRVKLRRGIVTFHDFEALAFKVLSDPSPNVDAPSEIAFDYQQQFAHVLVDEYQDTSPLQDAIVRRVSRDESAHPHANRFLVGDYKQSIYRFRFADPALFLELLEQAGTSESIRRIDLADNFRSLPGVLHFVNACFSRLMDRAVGELAYTEVEALKPRREPAAGMEATAVEVHWLPCTTPGQAAAQAAAQAIAAAAQGDDDDADAGGDAPESLEGVEAQAAFVARRIRALTHGATGMMIPDEEAGDGALRRARPGDCAILLRSPRSELAIWTGALESEGLKVRTAGVNPLFSTPELLDVLSALRVADNPLQDLPLAGLMRSPMFGFSDDALLAIRACRRRGFFHEAVWAAAGRGEALAGDAPGLPGDTAAQLGAFMQRVDGWRHLARTASSEEVLDEILVGTRYEAWLAGRPDATARLTHLDFLRGLLRGRGGSERGSNGLAEFLESVDQAEGGGEELGELPETVTEQHDSVTLLTIHRSKGLEFPIVFLPRLEKKFRRATAGELMLDREAPMALEGIDTERRRRYRTPALAALRELRRRQEQSEEMRLLYVGMTRARERLVLVGQFEKPQELAAKWGGIRAGDGRGLPALERLAAACPADLIGPVIEWIEQGGPAWLRVERVAELPAPAAERMWPAVRHALQQTTPDAAAWQEAIEELEAAAGTGGEGTETAARVIRLLPPDDPGQGLTVLPVKVSVTGLIGPRPAALGGGAGEKGANAGEDDAADAAREAWLNAEREMLSARDERTPATASALPNLERPSLGGPAWLETTARTQARLDAGERGTLIHTLLARLDLRVEITAQTLAARAEGLIAERAPQADAARRREILAELNLEGIEWFFGTEIGRKMTGEPGRVLRELPFTARRPIHELDPATGAQFPGEAAILQGVIDVVIDEGENVFVIDYKTDRVRDAEHLRLLRKHYARQVGYYQRALEEIWGVQSVLPVLAFLNARQLIYLTGED